MHVLYTGEPTLIYIIIFICTAKVNALSSDWESMFFSMSLNLTQQKEFSCHILFSKKRMCIFTQQNYNFSFAPHPQKMFDQNFQMS